VEAVVPTAALLIVVDPAEVLELLVAPEEREQ
jgi:hypothetical protein